MTPCRPQSVRRRRRALAALWCLALGSLLALAGLVSGASSSSPVVVVEVDGPIGPATSDYFQRALARAHTEHQAQLVIMRLDTPGGLDTAMRDMVRAILASEVPVVGYVAPGGARAASAGTYLLYASHIAAMAPATHLGSATPVQIGGMPGQPEQDPNHRPDGEQDDDGKRRGGSAMERKVLEDAVAYIRGLAERRDRNADWAERAVRDAVNLTAPEALAENVINLLARDMAELLAQLDGQEVALDAGPVTLATADATVITLEPDWRHQLLSVITHPNIAYFLMLVGFYGIIFELASPGNIYPGVTGAICLVLALYAFQVLPVNYAGLALILLGVLFIIGEAFLPSFGALGIGGVISFVFGSVILMDDAHLAVSLPLIGGMALIAAGLMLWTMTRLLSLRRRRPQTGEEALVGEVALALADFDEEGRVRVLGESWLASASAPVKKGDKLRVVAVQGLRLHVEPAGQSPAPHKEK